MTTVAVLGTGKMGAGMARQLLEHGHDVRDWNRSRDKAEAIDGADVADSPADAVRGAEVVLVSLFDADAVVDVLDQAAEALAGTLVVQTTTVGLDFPRVAEAAERAGARLLDAPVLGTRQPAEQGTLTVLVAGEGSGKRDAQQVLDAIGAKTVDAGEEPGAASRLKLACNAWLGALTAAVGQSVALAEALGLEGQLFLDAIEGSAVDTPYAHLKGAAMISGDMPVAFDVAGITKDTRLIQQAARENGVATDLVDAVLALFERTQEQGHDGDDMAAVRTAF